MSHALAILTAIVHALIAAGWFGAMLYSVALLQPRAHRYFELEAQYETFIATISRGARWKVLSALALIGVTGVALMLLNWPARGSAIWLALIAAKMLLWLGAIGVLIHVSWRLWPRRIFATEDELPAIRRAFQRAGLTLLTIAALATALGIVAHYLR